MCIRDRVDLGHGQVVQGEHVVKVRVGERDGVQLPAALVQDREDRLGVRRGVDDERPAVSPDDGAVGAQGAERQRHDLHGQNSLLVS